MRSIRIFFAAAFAVLLSGLGIALTPSSAHADDIYRYWAYFNVTDGAYVAAQTGPADANPADGSIDGYRWAAPGDFTNPNAPRADLKKVTFDAVCADTKAESGKKRVAVLIDYGVEQDAPKGTTPPEPQALCALVPTDANSLQVLESVASKVRTQSAGFGPLVCGIDNYPTTGCADEKADAASPADKTTTFQIGADKATKASAASTEEDSGSNVGLLITVAVVAVVVIAGGVFAARRRSAE